MWPRSRSARALEPVKPVRFGRGEQPHRRVDRPSLEARLSRGQRTIRAPPGLLGQGDRALQECRRRGEAATRLRPAGRALPAPRRPVRQVPSPPPPDATHDDPDQLRGQSPPPTPNGPNGDPAPPPIDTTAERTSGCRNVTRSEIASSPSASAARAAAGSRPSRAAARRSRNGSPTGSAAATSNRRRVSQGSVFSRRTKLSSIRPDERLRLRQPEPTRQLRRRQSPRQLQQCQGVAPRLRDDPVSHSLIDLEPQRRFEQCPGVAVAHAAHLEPADVHKRLACLPRSEHNPDRIGHHAPGHKGQRESRRLIQPLCVIDDTQQRTFLGDLREQAQDSQGNEEPSRRGTRTQAEHDLQRLALRNRQSLEPIEQRRACLMQAGERQLHL